MNTKEENGTYNIIPSIILSDKRLPASAKLLYGDILALSKKKGYVWATNQYFAKKYNMHRKSISRLISTLEKCGYITIKLIQREKGCERKIFMTNEFRTKQSRSTDNNVDTSLQSRQEPIANIVQSSPQKGGKNITPNNTLKNTFERQRKAPNAQLPTVTNEEFEPTNYRALYKKNLNSPMSVECYCGKVLGIPFETFMHSTGEVSCSNPVCRDPRTNKPFKFRLDFLRSCKEYPPNVIDLNNQ